MVSKVNILRSELNLIVSISNRLTFFITSLTPYYFLVGTGGGVVRVVYKELEQRALLRGMHGAIQDLAFAHVSNAILACVDYSGNLFIHTIESTPSELLCSLVLQVDAEESSPTSHRVIWCPYIPEDDPSDGDEVSKLLVLTRGSKAELWSVATVAARFRSIEVTVYLICILCRLNVPYAENRTLE